MRQRGLLFCPECQATTSDGGVTIPRCRRETMPRPIRKPIAGALQPLLRLDHVARGKAVLAAPVLPQRHQLGRGPHRAHHLVELILSVAVPERELRQVALRECRLLPRDGVERDFRIGEDLLAVRAGDPGMVLDPLGLKPLSGHTRRRRPDLVLRLKVDALVGIGAMIDPPLQPQLGHALIHMSRPCLTPALQMLIAVPVAVLLAEPLRSHLAHRQHDMRVRLRTAVLRMVPMHVEVGDHPAPDELLFHEIAREANALLLAHLARDRKLHLARQLRVLALLACLHLVPQHGAVA